MRPTPTSSTTAVTWRTITLFVVILTVTLSQLCLVEGITCHDCNTLTEAGSCSSTSITRTCNGTMCRYFAGKVNGTSVTIRDCNSNTNFTGCAQTESTDSSGRLLSGVSCYCNSTDLCASPAETPPHPVTQPPLPWDWLSTPFGAAFVTPTADFSCYQCNSLTHDFCGVDLNPNEHYESCPGAACLTYAGTIDDVYVVSRDCALYVSPALDECVTEVGEMDGHTFSGVLCHCKSSYCNGDIGVPAALQANATSAAGPTSAPVLSLSLLAPILASINIFLQVAIVYPYSN